MNKGNGIFDISEDCASKISKPLLSGRAVTFLHSKGQFTYLAMSMLCPGYAMSH
jgi:hypothetical protein